MGEGTYLTAASIPERNRHPTPVPVSPVHGSGTGSVSVHGRIPAGRRQRAAAFLRHLVVSDNLGVTGSPFCKMGECLEHTVKRRNPGIKPCPVRRMKVIIGCGSPGRRPLTNHYYPTLQNESWIFRNGCWGSTPAALIHFKQNVSWSDVTN